MWGNESLDLGPKPCSDLLQDSADHFGVAAKFSTGFMLKRLDDMEYVKDLVWYCTSSVELRHKLNYTELWPLLWSLLASVY